MYSDFYDKKYLGLVWPIKFCSHFSKATILNQWTRVFQHCARRPQFPARFICLRVDLEDLAYMIKKWILLPSGRLAYAQHNI